MICFKHVKQTKQAEPHNETDLKVENETKAKQNDRTQQAPKQIVTQNGIASVVTFRLLPSDWIQLDPAGSSWIQLDPGGSSWIQLDPH